MARKVPKGRIEELRRQQLQQQGAEAADDRARDEPPPESAPVTEPTAPKGLNCPKCGGVTTGDSSFCPMCGYALQAYPSLTSPSREPSPGSPSFWSSPLFVDILLAFFLAAIGVIVAIVYLAQQKTERGWRLLGLSIGSWALWTVFFLFVQSLAVGPLPAISQQQSGVTLSQFNQLQPGTSYRQVCNTLGGPGTMLSETSIAGYYSSTYQWSGRGMIGANVIVMFDNGKMTSKAQFGLQ